MKQAGSLIVFAGILLAGEGALLLRPTSLPIAHAQGACTNANFQGAYGYTFNGSVPLGFSTGLFAAVGRLVADGQGSFSGAETTSLDGEILPRSYNGTYKVNPDCTGSAVSADNSGATVRCDFVIVAGGREIEVIEADAGTVVVGCLKQQ